MMSISKSMMVICMPLVLSKKDLLIAHTRDSRFQAAEESRDFTFVLKGFPR